MKTTKSPENIEVTPSKKKLTQARLPFKLLSDVSPKPDASQTRKRKLSAPEAESVTKVGKISKENDLIQEPVLISDDDSKDGVKPNKSEKLPNPYVKLVDAARKKKKKKKSTKVLNGSCEVQVDSINKEHDMEQMDVDEAPETEVNVSKDTQDIQSEALITDEDKKTTIKKNTVESSLTANGDIVILEDSDKPDDITENGDNKPEESNKNVKTSASPQGGSKRSKRQTKKNSLDKSLTETNTDDTSKKSPSKPEEEDHSAKKDENQVTPKRSMRMRTKVEPNNNSKGSPSTKLNESLPKASPSSKLNDSVSSAPSTPKTSRNSSVTNSVGDVSLNESTTSATLTPKQMQKKLESAKKREEREKEKQEREKKRQQEKEERAKLKQEKEEQKKREREEKEEAKRKEKEDKEEQKRKEREEKEKQKELEKKQREEKEEQKRKEREEKEEQRRKEKEAREEEKRKRQEALELEKQEQELKKKKAAEAFVNFFVPKQKSDKDQPIICSVGNSMLTNFTIKNDMRLAPLVRVNLTDDKKQYLDNLLDNQDENVSYLKSLKDGVAKPLSSGKTWPLSDKDDDDVMIVEDAELPPIDGAGEILSCEPVTREKLRPKLLSFHENRRPPFWGTWRKKSAAVKPRKPFGQDQKHVDYEVDSDEEWEEEQEGESIDGSAAGSDDEQDGDEYEVDNVVFVPHGYLSDEEATMEEDDMMSLSPETQQARLKHLEDEFESEMKKPTEKLKPRMYGLLWETADGGKPDNCVDALWNYFSKMAMIMNDPTPLLQPSSEPEEGEKKKVKRKKQSTQPDGELKQKSPKSEKQKKQKTDDKESKTPKTAETKKNVAEAKKNQPGINMFLTKVKSS